MCDTMSDTILTPESCIVQGEGSPSLDSILSLLADPSQVFIAIVALSSMG